MSYNQGRALEQKIVQWAKAMSWDAGRHASSKGSHDVSILVPTTEASLLTGGIFLISCKAGKQSFASERSKMKAMSQRFPGVWVLITGSTRTITSVWAFEDGETRMSLATHLMMALIDASEKMNAGRKSA